MTAGSIALAGFGLDSVIEFALAVVVVWQLRGRGGQERKLRLIGVTFFALTVYPAVQGIRDLAGQVRPESSVPGLAVAATALIVMPLLAVAKRRTGQALGSSPVIQSRTPGSRAAVSARYLGTGNAAMTVTLPGFGCPPSNHEDIRPSRNSRSPAAAAGTDRSQTGWV